MGAVMLGLIALLIRKADPRQMPDAGITKMRADWHLAPRGAALWFIPARSPSLFSRSWGHR